jgi:hypothetical protein
MADETTFDRLVVAIENKQLRMQVFWWILNVFR